MMVSPQECTHRNLYFTGGQRHLVCSDCHHGWTCDPEFPKTQGSDGPPIIHETCSGRGHLRNLETSPEEKARLYPVPLEQALLPWANWLASRYGHPVWLCGSALKKGWSARDIDVFVEFPDDEFEQRWGVNSGQYALSLYSHEHASRIRRLQDEVAKISRGAHGHLMINIDFKLLPKGHADRWSDQPRKRLDNLDLGGEPDFMKAP